MPINAMAAISGILLTNHWLVSFFPPRFSLYQISRITTQLIYLITTETTMKFFQSALLLAGSANAFVPQTSFSTTTRSALNAVSKKDSYSVTLLPGDGIGPEITEATKKVIQAVCEKSGFQMNLKEALIGGAAIDAVNDPFPKESLDQCLASDSVLLACIGGYKWDNNPRELRPETGLFANLRPAKVLSQLVDASTLKREIVEGVDVMVVRELTGDVYFGTPKGIDVVNGEFIILLGKSINKFETRQKSLI
jgi:isocitrate dehydrogenase